MSLVLVGGLSVVARLVVDGIGVSGGPGGGDGGRLSSLSRWSWLVLSGVRELRCVVWRGAHPVAVWVLASRARVCGGEQGGDGAGGGSSCLITFVGLGCFRLGGRGSLVSVSSSA
jgi:hypothetical protein